MSHPLSMQFASLQEALLTSNPSMPNLLREIHTQLKKDPDVVTLLSEEEISQVVRGLSHLTAVKFAESVTSTSKKASITKSLKSANMDLL